MKKVIIGILSLAFATMAGAKSLLPYQNPKLSPEERAEDLLSRMTLDEKVAQLQCMWFDKQAIFTNGKFDEKKAAQVLKNGLGQFARLNEDLRPNLSGYHNTLHPRQGAELYNQIQKFFLTKTRLGIPVMSHEEGLHGQQSKDATSFPVPIAMASSWNPDLVGRCYGAVAREIRSRGGSIGLIPVVDVTEDPRWGRTEETMGEDPYLNGTMGIAALRAAQGTSEMIDKQHVACNMKHFGVHGASQGGVNIAPSFIDEHQAMEMFLRPFEMTIKEIQPASLMITYNELWGMPAHGNHHLLTDILRGRFGFKGVTVSDYDGIKDMVGINHVTPSIDEAGVIAMNAGVDVELPMVDGYKHLAEAVKEGKVSEVRLDEAVKHVLIEKFRLGLFDDPYVDPAEVEKIVGCEAHRKLAYEMATESMVLLKNDGTLPLDKSKIHTIALIGPNANRCILGGYSSQPKDTISPLQAMKEKYGKQMNILYAEGCRLTDLNSPFPPKIKLYTEQDNADRIREAVETAKKADVILLFVGENESMSREAYGPQAPGDLPDLELLAGQQKLVKEIAALGKPTVACVNSGTTQSIGDLEKETNATLQCWYLGQETGYAVVDALFGDVNPSGKLTISFPRDAGHIPAYYNYKPSAKRGYNLGFDITPLHPFGYGLSYTTYRYSAPRLNVSKVPRDQVRLDADGRNMSGNTPITVSVDVTNTGSRKGKEIVEMYIRDDYSSMPRPVKELKGFQKIELAPGETKTVSIPITAQSLAFYNAKGERVIEPGTFSIEVGPSSDNTQSTVLSVEQ